MLDTILLTFAALLLLPYWLGPFVVRFKETFFVRPPFEPFDPGRHRLPPDVTAVYQRSVDALREDGFELVGEAFQVGKENKPSIRMGCLEHPGTGDQALAAAAEASGKNHRLAVTFVELMAVYADGRILSVYNNPQVEILAARPERVLAPFPEVRDPIRLVRVTRALQERWFRGAERTGVDLKSDPVGFLSAAVARDYQYQVERGLFWLDPTAFPQVYRPTWFGAFVLVWRLLPPMSLIRAALRRRRARRLLRGLGMEGQDREPVPHLPQKEPNQWNWAVALGLVLFTLAGGTRAIGRSFAQLEAIGSNRPIALRADYTVPNDFPGAVRVLERLSGTKAVPLQGMDTLGNVVPTRGMSVGVSQRMAEALLEQAQARFLERGFYLFRHARDYGVKGTTDSVGLWPGKDPYEALALMGTNGDNYDIGTRQVIRWLKALEREQPFVLTGMGFDWIEARFTGPIRDPKALAHRLNEFCPDIVTQGTGDVESLAQDLAATRTFFCWWD
jgi:uncharacterized protein DUF4253